MKTILTYAFLFFSTYALTAQTASISGKVTDLEGNSLPGINLQLLDESGAVVASANNVNEYIFTDIPTGKDYTLQVSKAGSPLNGLSTFDVVLMHKHILGTGNLSNPYQILAGDVNGSSTVSVADIIEMRLVILGVIPEFRNGKNWGFLPAAYAFQNPSNPFTETANISNTFTLNDDISGFDYIGYKYGDLNGTYVPE